RSTPLSILAGVQLGVGGEQPSCNMTIDALRLSSSRTELSFGCFSRFRESSLRSRLWTAGNNNNHGLKSPDILVLPHEPYKPGPSHLLTSKPMHSAEHFCGIILRFALQPSMSSLPLTPPRP